VEAEATPTLVIVNPTAGRGRALAVWERARSALGETANVEYAITSRPGEATVLARAAAERGCGRVVAVGGDGTVLEVANALVHRETAMAIVPAGTGNDTAANLGIPRDPIQAARLSLRGVPRAIDAGEVDSGTKRTYFVNIAGFGFDAEVAARVNRMHRLVGGTVPYVVGVLGTLASFRAPPMRLLVDGQLYSQRVFLAAVGNGPSYGGGMRVVPEAVPDDGELDVCVIGHVSRLDVLKLVPRMYSGGHRSHPAVRLRRCHEVRAESDAAVRCQADGELIGSLPATFRVHHAALRCVTG
jgi:YegS/Rv2252/BmrU family lipid kinase